MSALDLSSQPPASARDDPNLRVSSLSNDSAAWPMIEVPAMAKFIAIIGTADRSRRAERSFVLRRWLSIS